MFSLRGSTVHGPALARCRCHADCDYIRRRCYWSPFRPISALVPLLRPVQRLLRLEASRRVEMAEVERRSWERRDGSSDIKRVCARFFTGSKYLQQLLLGHNILSSSTGYTSKQIFRPILRGRAPLLGNPAKPISAGHRQRWAKITTR